MDKEHSKMLKREFKVLKTNKVSFLITVERFELNLYFEEMEKREGKERKRKEKKRKEKRREEKRRKEKRG